MAYTPPDLDPSAADFADLRRAGFIGVLDAVLDVNGFSVAEATALRRLAKAGAGAAAGEAVDSYTTGDPVDRAVAVARLQEAATGAAVLLAAINECGVLVDADTTPITTVGLGNPAGVPPRQRRVFS